MLSLFLGGALLYEGRFEAVVQALGPAEQQPTTKATAAALNGIALEELGDQVAVGNCIQVLLREKARLQLAELLENLEISSTTRGIRASVEADSLGLEAAAQRFLGTAPALRGARTSARGRRDIADVTLEPGRPV